MVPKLVSNDRPVLDLQEFLKNRRLSFWTSDADFRDLLDELFHMVKKNFRRKIKIGNFKLQVLFQGPM